MILTDPAAVLEALIRGETLPLSGLPRTHGLYTLHDHEGVRRYIGTTESDPCGFHRRVAIRHVSGSENHSHKFTRAYNVGRMWRERKEHPGQETKDAEIAKVLRSLFARRFCGVTIFPIANHGLPLKEFAFQLKALEKRVQQLAPPIMRSWEGKRFQLTDEPRDKVDLLLDELKWSDAQRASIDRQAALFSQL